MLRSAWIIVSSTFVTFILSVVAIFSGLINPYSNFTDGVIRVWASTLLKIAGIKVEVTGMEYIDPEKSYVFMANHQSLYDIMTCLSIIPITARFIAKEELFRIPVFAQGIKAVGMIPVDRSNRKKAHDSLEKAVSEIKKGISVIIFPEGTRTRDGKIQSFKKGGFVLAIKGDIPIVPMVLSGAREIMQKQNLRLNKGNIKLEFLEPIDTSKYSYEERGELLEVVRNKIVTRYEQIN